MLDFLKDNAFTAMIVGIATAIAGWLGIRTQRAPNAVEERAALDAAAAALLNSYRTRLTDTESEMRAVRSEVAELRDKLDAAERKLDGAEREIEAMVDHIGVMARLMVEHGIDPPPYRTRVGHDRPAIVPATD